MSKEQHNWDMKRLKGKHKSVPKKTDGGACLNRHDGTREKGGKGVLRANSCNHRWQAFKKALEHKGTYNWPAYESLSQQQTIVMVGRSKCGKIRVKAPDAKTKSWNITATGENFRTSCNKPWWHEAHHIVPNNILKTCISGGNTLKIEYVKMIRGGLLDEKYNLNHKLNMIILPMDRKVAKALQLPRHRMSAEHRSHKTYSKHVKKELDKILGPVREELEKHEEPPDYQICKEAIEALSEDLYPKIVDAGKLMASGEMKGTALDQIPENHLTKRVSKVSKRMSSRGGPKSR